MTHAEKAKNYFKEGCNCAQAVLAAFSDVIGLDEQSAKKIAMGLGGGVGRMREVCGAVSAAAMVLGALAGGSDGSQKKEAYAAVQEFALRFKQKNGSIVCRELLKLKAGAAALPTPDERTEQYYKVRPCAELVYNAAEIVDEMIALGL